MTTLTKFDGSRDKYELWKSEFEKTASAQEWSWRKKKAKLVASLEGTAAIFYNKFWSDKDWGSTLLLKAMDKYFGNASNADALIKISKMTQGSDKVMEFASRVLMGAGGLDREEIILPIFINGLNEPIKREVNKENYTDFKKALQAALREENNLPTASVFEIKQNNPATIIKNKNPDATSSPTILELQSEIKTLTSIVKDLSQKICSPQNTQKVAKQFKQKEQKHKKVENKNFKAMAGKSQSSNSQDVRCQFCSKLGHTAKNCFKLKKLQNNNVTN